MKLWVYYADVGGGHRAAANALVEAFAERYPDKTSTILINATEGGSSWARFLVDKGYEFLINKADWLWRILYQFSKFGPIAWLENFLHSVGMRHAMERHLKEHKPDAVVSTYFLLAPIIHLFKRHNITVPITVVVTDWFTVHPMWFRYKALSFIVFSEAVRTQALKAGVPSSNITVLPPIINKKFFVIPDEKKITQLKETHGLKNDVKTVLLAGGGSGLPQGEHTLKALVDSDIEAQYIVVCGHDAEFQKKAENIARHARQKIVVFGFVDFMQTLIAAADAVVTKGGPAMIMETIILQKPLVITHYIWEQEKGNMQFVVDNKVGLYEPSSAKVPRAVKKIFTDPATQKMFSENCARIRLRPGTEEIVDLIYKRITSSEGTAHV